MKLIQEIKQDKDFAIKVYATDNVQLENYDLDDYKVAGIVFSFLDRFKEMIKFREKFNFEVKKTDKRLYFTYTDDLLILVDIKDSEEEKENLYNDKEEIITFD